MDGNNRGEKIGLLNQSTFEQSFDDSILTDQMNESVLEYGKNDKGSKTGKWKATDLFDKNGAIKEEAREEETIKPKPGPGPQMAAQNLEDLEDVNINDKEDKEDMSFVSKESIEKMSAAQIDVLSSQLNREQFYAMGKFQTYMCFVCLILISVVNTMQRSMIAYMFMYQSEDEDKNSDELR